MQIDCEKLAASIHSISNELKNHNDECDAIAIRYERATNLIIVTVYYCDIKNIIAFPANMDIMGVKINIDYIIRCLIKYSNQIEEN